VLCHLKTPWDALREMLRVTKVGGLVAAREGDLETECLWPELPGLLQFHDFSKSAITSSGGSVTAGRQLLSWTLRAGVRREQIAVSFGTWCYIEPRDKQAWGITLSLKGKFG
jgi:hypothetical protein